MTWLDALRKLSNAANDEKQLGDRWQTMAKTSKPKELNMASPEPVDTSAGRSREILNTEFADYLQTSRH